MKDNKIETIKSVTKGDINDLKSYAKAIGVKCENCYYFKNVIKDKGVIYGNCGDRPYELKGDYFCKEFEKK